MSELKDLVEAAREAAKRAYAPYSGFRVGAAIQTLSGRIFVGCNVENASYGLASCAERNAVAAAFAAGDSVFTRLALAVSTGEVVAPCGACRQVLAEFATDLEIVMVGARKTERTTLRDLLPRAFRAGNLVSPRVPEYSKSRTRRKR